MRRGLICATAALALTACSQKSESISEAAPEPASRKEPAAPPAPATFSEVDQSLKAGSFDDAAARLLEMRTVRTDFTPQEAAEYRRKLNEAYSAALEAAEKGDPRAKAAIEMIRANPGR
jgi:hypothetical protein